MKYIRIASDLHLEAFTGRRAEDLCADFLPPDARDEDSILVLAGDISSNGEQLLDFLEVCCKRFKKVYYVAGNHEWYRHDYKMYSSHMKKTLLDRATYGDIFANLEFSFDSVGYEEIDDLKLRFIFCPLWADGGPSVEDQAQVQFYLNDFRLITNGYHQDHGSLVRFTVQDMIREHRAQKYQLEEYLKQPFDGRTVVITHHLPSRRLVSERFWPKDGSDGANGGFASNCDNMIAVHEPWLWVHGHTHDTIDTQLWKTRIVCNPCGYRGEWSSPFNSYMRSEMLPDGSKKAIVEPKFVEL